MVMVEQRMFKRAYALKRVYALFTSAIILSFCFAADSSGESPQRRTVNDHLLKKGFSQEIINLLNPLCQEQLNKSIPEGVLWYGTFDRDAKSVTVDFQTKEKAHTTVTVVSNRDNGCMTVQQAIIMTTGMCKPESEAWINSYKKHGIKMKIEEENKQRIALSAEGNMGIKVYLYQMGNLCMQVFRNVETLSKLKK